MTLLGVAVTLLGVAVTLLGVAVTLLGVAVTLLGVAVAVVVVRLMVGVIVLGHGGFGLLDRGAHVEGDHAAITLGIFVCESEGATNE